MLTGIFEAALRSLLLAVLVWADLRVFRVHNVIYQRLAWTAVLAGAVLMPFLLPFTAQWATFSFATIQVSSPLPRVQSALSPAKSLSAPIAIPSSISAQTTPPPIHVTPPHRSTNTPKADAAVAHVDPAPIVPARTTSALDAVPPTHSTRPHISIFSLIALAYFLVATALLIRLLLGFISAIRLWRSATPIAPSSNSFFDANLNLRTSNKISSPVTIGSGIVLPTGYTSWSQEKLRIVLAHERTHVTQRDFHLLTLASLYTAVTWFSPLGWWLKHKLSDLGEAISDRSGLDAASNRSAYAQILLEFAATPRPTLIGVAMARPSSITRRIERLLNDSYLRHAFSGSRSARLAVLLVPVVLFAGAALVRVQAATQSTQTAPAPSSAGATLAPLAPPSADALPATLAPPSTDAFSAPLAPPSADAFPAPASPSAPVPPSGPGSTVVPDSATSTTLPPPPPDAFALATPPAPPDPHAGVGNAPAQVEASFDRNLTFDGKLELSVATGSGHITLTRGSANQIHIHGVVKTNQDGDAAKVQEIAANPPIEQAGNKITIGANRDQEKLRNVSIDYDIEAPADATLSAATGSGNITDTGVGQNAKLQTGSGSIMATGLEGGFKIQTGSGNISVDDNGQGDATVQTGSGDIDVKGVHGALKAQTGSGEIKVAGTPSSAWKLQTGSGSVELATGSAPMNLDATTGSGRISTEGPAQQTSSEEDHHHYRAQINGGGPEVSVVTGSGSIHVR
jgi:beta-lactamase regulating signal transducer with metallopeptidase domain